MKYRHTDEVLIQHLLMSSPEPARAKKQYQSQEQRFNICITHVPFSHEAPKTWNSAKSKQCKRAVRNLKT